jgi:hypothetical protein
MSKQLAAMLVLLSTLNMTSCSKVKDLENKTTNMDRNTSEMNNTTNQMKDTTIQMKDTTSNMYSQIRTKETEDSRSKKMTIIQSDAAGMGEKIAAAAVFYKSFEFQTWTANGTFDDMQVRDDLFLDAVKEYYKRMTDIYTRADIEDMSPLNQDSKKYNDEMAFYAMAVAMHENIHHQEEIHAHSKVKFEVRSFLNLLDVALTKEENGEELTEYEDVILSGEYRDITIELMQARFNMILALVCKDTTSKKEMTMGQKIKGLGFQITGGKVGSLELTSTFSDANDSTKRDVLKKLDATMKTKAILDRINVEVKFDESLKSVFENLEITENKSATAQDLEYNEYIKQLKDM